MSFARRTPCCAFCAPPSLFAQEDPSSRLRAACARRSAVAPGGACVPSTPRHPRRAVWRAAAAATPPADDIREDGDADANAESGGGSDDATDYGPDGADSVRAENGDWSSADPTLSGAGAEAGHDADQDRIGKDSREIIDMDALQKRMLEVRELEEAGVDEKEKVLEFTMAYDTDFVSDEEETVDEDTMRMLNEQFDQMDVLYVILFSSKNDSEGVYSLALNGISIVLAFQEKSEARRYALMLETQDFPAPHVGEFSAAELKNFCGESGYRLGLVPKGSLLTPPEDTVDGNLEEWSHNKASNRDDDRSSLDPDEVELMKRRLESLFGES